MKKTHLNTTVSVVLSAVSAALIFYQYKFQPAFDFRLVAGILGVMAWFAAMSEFVKYTSYFQFTALFLAGLVAGLSVDKIMPIPYLTIALFLVNLSMMYRYFIRKHIAEAEYQWLDPTIYLFGIIFYVLGNINNNLGWMGWVFPVAIIGMVGFIFFKNMMFGRIQTAFAKKKMGVESGKNAPLFSLPDHDGNIVSLADFIGQRNVLLIFVRGDWCPSCHMKLRTYQKHSNKFQEKNVVLFAIGPDPVGVNKEMASKLGLEFKVLADEGQKTAMAYSVQLPSSLMGEEYNPGIPLPASFLIDKNGIVRYSSRPDKIGEFLNPESIFPILQSLN